MSTDKKEEPKYIFQEYHPKGGSFHDSDSDSLFKFYEGFNAKTVEAEDKRKQIQNKSTARIDSLQNIVNKTLTSVHGAHPDSESTPLKYDLANVEGGDKHAIALLDGLVDEFYKQHFGEDTYKASKATAEGRRQMLRQFDKHLEENIGRGFDYSELLNRITSTTDYADTKEFKQLLEKLHHVEEISHIESVQKLLARDRRHEKYVSDKVNELYSEHGVQLKEGVSQEKAFGALKNAITGNEHIEKYTHKKIFVPYEGK